MSELLHDLHPGTDSFPSFEPQRSSPVIVTAAHASGGAVGLTVTSLVTVSTAPALVSFVVKATSSRWPALEQAEHIGLHQPTPGDDTLVEQFDARSSGAPGTVRRHLGPYSVPLLDDCRSRAVAHLQQRIHTGGHVIVVARLLPEQTISRAQGDPGPPDLRLVDHVLAVRDGVPEVAPVSTIDVSGGGPGGTGPLVVDRDRRAVSVDGRPVTLTNREFELLAYLLGRQGLAVSRAELIREVWGVRYTGGTRTLDVHVRRLRMKLGVVGGQLATVRGYGYSLGQDPLSRADLDS